MRWAVKYGALSNRSGQINVQWSLSDATGEETFDFLWREQGGPPVAPPVRIGFSTRLINAGLTGSANSPSKIDCPPPALLGAPAEPYAQFRKRSA